MNRRQRRYLERKSKSYQNVVKPIQTYQEFINSVELTPELMDEIKLYEDNQKKNNEDNELKIYGKGIKRAY